MRRIVTAMLLLTCVSSCMGVRRNPPFDGMGVQQAANRAQPPVPAAGPPPAPAAWCKAPTRPTSMDASREAPVTANSSADPGVAIAALPPLPEPARSSSPYGAGTLPAMPLPAGATSGEGGTLSAFATSSGSGFGAAPNVLPPPPSPTVSAAPATPPAAVEKPSEPVIQVACAELRQDAAPVEARSAPALAPLPVIVNRPLSSPATLLPAPQDSDQGAAPGGPILRIVNSKRITFHCELREAGPSGSGAIELWSTRDMKSWKKCEATRPTPNTFALEVKDEGLYGFMLVARGTGSSAGPRPCDLPQVWVTVDTIRPVVQLLGVDLNLTAKTPTLVIRWSAQDRNFNKRPITISYAEQPDGPWVPLASGLENTGRYEKPPTAFLPHHFFVRIEAVDTAGNSGTAQSPSPVHLELSGPQTTAAGAAVAPMPEAPRLLPAPPAMDLVRPAASIVSVEAN